MYGWLPQFPVPSEQVPDDEPIQHAPGEDPQAPAGQDAMLAFLMNSGIDLGELIHQMSGPQPGVPSFELPEPSSEGLTGPTMPTWAAEPLDTDPPEVERPDYEPTTELTVPRVRSRQAPKTKMDWVQALMPAIMGGVAGAFGGKAGVAGALKGYNDAGQQDIQNAQRQQQIDQQRAVLEANERRYAEMDRYRQSTEKRMRTSAGSAILERALKTAATLDDPDAQAEFLRMHAPELAVYGIDLTQAGFLKEVSERSKNRIRDWATKALDANIAEIQKIHGNDVDLGEYFKEGSTKYAATTSGGGSVSMRKLAQMAGRNPDDFVVAPTELKLRAAKALSPEAGIVYKMKLSKFKREHGGADPDDEQDGQLMLDTTEAIADARRAESASETLAKLGPNPTLTQLAEVAGMTEQGLRSAVDQFTRSGKLPTLGIGGQSSRIVLMSAKGILHPRENLAANAATYAAQTNSLKQLDLSVRNLQGFHEAALNNMTLAETLQAKSPQAGTPLLNQPLRTLNRWLGGSEAQNATAALDVARREVARITNDPRMKGVLTVYASKHINEILPDNSTMQTVLDVFNTLKQDMSNVEGGLVHEREQLLEELNRPLSGPKEGVYVDQEGHEVDARGKRLPSLAVTALEGVGGLKPTRSNTGTAAPAAVTPTATPKDATTPGATRPAAAPTAGPKKFGAKGPGGTAWFETEEQRDFYIMKRPQQSAWSSVTR